MLVLKSTFAKAAAARVVVVMCILKSELEPGMANAHICQESSGQHQHMLPIQVREGADVVMTAIGGEAAAVAIRAVCHARGYLAVSAMCCS